MPENIDDLARRERADSINRVAVRMKQYLGGDLLKVQRFARVYTLAKSIGEMERLDEDEQLDLELAAIVHDVDSDKIPEVREILHSCGINDAVSVRVCEMVANARNYDHIASLDRQILAEAIMIVDFKENETPGDEIVRIAEERFITNTGKLFLKRAFNI